MFTQKHVPVSFIAQAVNNLYFFQQGLVKEYTHHRILLSNNNEQRSDECRNWINPQKIILIGKKANHR